MATTEKGRLGSVLLLVRRVAFNVKCVRAVRLYRTLVEEIIRETQRYTPHEVGFAFEKQYDTRTGTITYPRIKRDRWENGVWPGHDGQVTIWQEHLDPNEVNTGHTHPFEDRDISLCIVSSPASGADFNFIRERLHRVGGRNLGNNAHIILGRNRRIAPYWAVGAWTSNERELCDGVELHELDVAQSRPVDAPAGYFRVIRTDPPLEGICSLPLTVVHDETFRPLTDAELRRVGIVYINNTKPYLSEGPEDVGDIISLRQWVYDASRFEKGQFRFKDESEHTYVARLTDILSRSSRPELKALQKQVQRIL